VRRVKGRLLPLLERNLVCAQEAVTEIWRRHSAPLAANVAASPCAYAGIGLWLRRLRVYGLGLGLNSPCAYTGAANAPPEGKRAREP
jgi:hypothetical protein